MVRTRSVAPTLPAPAGRSAGFSLVELLVVIAMLSIVMAAALPNFARFTARDRVDGAAQEIQSALMLARQKAIAKRSLYRISLSGTPAVLLVERQADSGWVADPATPLTLNPTLQVEALFGEDPGNLQLLVGPQGLIEAVDAPAEFTVVNEQADSAVVRMVRTGRIRIDVH